MRSKLSAQNSQEFKIKDVTSIYVKNIHHKVLSSGLAIQYGTDENFSLLIRHISALAFLPHSNIPAALDELRTIMPEEARRTSRNETVIRSEPLFPPSLWSVSDNIKYVFPRTQNSVEA